MNSGAPYLSDGITIRNPNTNITFSYSDVGVGIDGKFVVNYIDKATKAKAEEIVSAAKKANPSTKFVLGEKVI